MPNLVPGGFRLTGLHCGLKRKPEKLDLSLVVCDRPSVGVGVYTTNQVFAAPVKWDRARTPGDRIRGVVINSGNANACTGSKGDEDAQTMARWAGESCGAEAEQFLVLSTGVIGVFLPLEKVGEGIRRAATQLAADEAGLTAAARGMMTTDTVHKIASRSVALSGREVRITGMAKGAAMIAPNMATMLGVVMTDAGLTPDSAQSALKAAVADSFNCISVDGHMSTNDTVLLLASGAAGPVAASDLPAFQQALCDVCSELAKAIIQDGEGATHLITLDVLGCKTKADAHAIAKLVAESPLVKTAVAGGDPNWGRIVSAAGYAPVRFDPGKVTLHVNGMLLYQNGTPVDFDEAAASASIRGQRATNIILRFGEGDAGVRFWTTDLTAEYVRLNADYRT